MNAIEALVRAWRSEVEGDHVAPWHICKELRRRMPTASDDKVRQASLEVARGLLSFPQVEISTYDNEDSRYDGPWAVPVDEAIARIDLEWQALGRDPGPGEIGYIHSSLPQSRREPGNPVAPSPGLIQPSE
jgi:hypothetical protein